MFPDIEKTLAALFVANDLVAADRAGTWTPDNLGDVMPYVRVTRYGGGDDNLTDRAAVDVDTFAGNRTQAFDLAADIAELLRRGPHRVTVGSTVVILDRTTIDVGPVRRPWDNPKVRRFGITCTVSARRTR